MNHTQNLQQIIFSKVFIISNERHYHVMEHEPSRSVILRRVWRGGH